MLEKYPPTRFKRKARAALDKRAKALAKERGLDKISVQDYVTEASQFFEDNRKVIKESE